MSNKPVSPWPAGTDCPEPVFPAFKKALISASFHYADDSGSEWGSAGDRMREAARIAVEAEWPYWAIKRMYGEIKPLPSFDEFMGRYCVALRALAMPEAAR